MQKEGVWKQAVSLQVKLRRVGGAIGRCQVRAA